MDFTGIWLNIKNNSNIINNYTHLQKNILI